MIASFAQPNLFTVGTDAADIEAASATTEAAVLYRCRHCERTTKRPHLWRRTFTRTTTRTGMFAEIVWSLPDDRAHRGENPPAVPCSSCQRLTSGAAIRGRFSAAHRCDSRCIYAKGPDCECSCGGANHGIGHGR